MFQTERSVSRYWSEKQHMDTEKDKDLGFETEGRTCSDIVCCAC